MQSAQGEILDGIEKKIPVISPIAIKAWSIRELVSWSNRKVGFMPISKVTAS
ncbi:hypothetical protein LguiB_011868 [Lonicera macranthoides]